MLLVFLWCVWIYSFVVLYVCKACVCVCVWNPVWRYNHTPHSVQVTCEAQQTFKRRQHTKTKTKYMPINYIIVHKIETRAVRYLFSIVFDRLQFVWSFSISFSASFPFTGVHVTAVMYMWWKSGSLRHRKIDAVTLDWDKKKNK